MEKYTFTAAADLSAHQNNIMRLSAENTVHVASLATNSAIIGVLTNKPKLGKSAAVQYSGKCQVRAGAAVSANALITCNGSGRAVAVASGGMSIGRAIEAATADGDVIETILFHPIRWAGAI
jgi:hypothetical protein